MIFTLSDPYRQRFLPNFCAFVENHLQIQGNHIRKVNNKTLFRTLLFPKVVKKENKLRSVNKKNTRPSKMHKNKKKMISDMQRFSFALRVVAASSPPMSIVFSSAFDWIPSYMDRFFSASNVEQLS